MHWHLVFIGRDGTVMVGSFSSASIREEQPTMKRVAVLLGVAVLVVVPTGVALGGSSSPLGDSGSAATEEPQAMTPADIAASRASGHSTTGRADWQKEIDEIVASGGTWAQVSEFPPSPDEVARCKEELQKDPSFTPCAITVAQASGDLEPGIYRQEHLETLLQQQGLSP
jgi:hypothetical protein